MARLGNLKVVVEGKMVTPGAIPELPVARRPVRRTASP
jgi:hypothetical protein